MAILGQARVVVFMTALLSINPSYADFASDRKLADSPGILSTPKIKRLYPAKTSIGRLPWERNCSDLRTAAACIKRFGQPDERRRTPDGDEILVFYGEKQLYRGTGSHNSAVGREWTEHTAREGKIVGEFQVIQVIEWGYSWQDDALTQRSCENFDVKGTSLCSTIEPVGPVPQDRKMPADLASGRNAEQLAIFYFALIGRSQCERLFPDFAPRLSRVLDSLDERTRRLIAWFEESPEYGQDAKAMALIVDAMRPEERAQAEDICDDLPAMLAGPRAPDPRFSTPESTWETFLGALRRGDAETAISCLASSARSRLRPVLRKMNPDQMRSMAESFKEFSVTMSFGDMREALVVRHDGRAGLIYFQSRGNEWRISEI